MFDETNVHAYDLSDLINELFRLNFLLCIDYDYILSYRLLLPPK